MVEELFRPSWQHCSLPGILQRSRMVPWPTVSAPHVGLHRHKGAAIPITIGQAIIYFQEELVKCWGGSPGFPMGLFHQFCFHFTLRKSTVSKYYLAYICEYMMKIMVCDELDEAFCIGWNVQLERSKRISIVGLVCWWSWYLTSKYLPRGEVSHKYKYIVIVRVTV